MEIHDVIADLESFIYWLAGRRQADTILMEADELAGELFLELVKGYQYYEDKGLSHSQMLAVLRRMMDNRIGELVYKHYGTHRRLGQDAMDLYSFDEPDDSPITVRSSYILQASVQLNPEQLLLSRERFNDTMMRLRPEAQRVLKAIVDGDELLTMQLELTGDRMAAVGSGGSVHIRPWQVADALGMDERMAATCFTEIRRAYKEVCNGC